jgi:D-aspartate ligase
MPNNSNQSHNASGRIGAVVVGGDFHGLGIIRSLGSRGIPLCVVDDEYSIGRFSKYTTFTVRPPTLRKEQETVDFLVEMGKRMNLKGWVLFPTRDEHVAAFSSQGEAVGGLPRSHAGLGDH